MRKPSRRIIYLDLSSHLQISDWEIQIGISNIPEEGVFVWPVTPCLGSGKTNGVKKERGARSRKTAMSGSDRFSTVLRERSSCV